MLRHDLRNPLSAVIGAAGMPAKEPGLMPPHTRFVGLIITAATQAMDTSNLSGAIFRIQTGRFIFEPEPVPIGRKLGKALALAEVWRESKSTEFRLDLPAFDEADAPYAFGDPALCGSTFNNLLRNACQVAPPAGRVVIEAVVDTQVHVHVRNSGVMPPAARPNFFARCVASSQRGDTGLGTYSARLLAEAQGGSIAMTTDEALDETTITATLPCLPAGAADPPTGPTRRPPS